MIKEMTEKMKELEALCSSTSETQWLTIFEVKTSSRKTDRLLKRAEREKEDYADQVRQRISQEKQREIQVMMDKLSEITKESEDLLKDAAKDKEAYADQLNKEADDRRKKSRNEQASVPNWSSY